MRCEEIRDLLPLHVLGGLEPAEAEAVRRHLETGCPRCAAEAASFVEVTAQIPFAGKLEEPSPMAKARLMAAVRGAERAPAPRVPQRASLWSRAGWGAAAAAVVVAFFSGTSMSRRYQAEAADLRQQLQAQKEELARLEQQFRRTRDTILLVRSPGSKVIDLQGQEDLSGSAARVFWDVRRGSWRLYADNLPPAGAGKTYQLWLVTAQAKISAGVFDPATEESSGSVAVPADAGTVVAAAVTPEPEGGSPQPTGKIILLGKI
jgi:hypothetical protein